jgi:hypothetical protein
MQSSTSPTPPPSLPPTQSPTSPPACCPFGVKGYCKQVWLGEEPQVGLLHNCNGTRATCTGKIFTCDMNNDSFEFDICFCGPSTWYYPWLIFWGSYTTRKQYVFRAFF